MTAVLPAICGVSPLLATSERAANHENMNRLEAEIMKLPKVIIQIIHHFAPGIYAREMRAPKGAVITGKIHRTRHLNIISQGRLRVFNELGDLSEIEAPFSFVSEPGTRRAALIHDDVVWTTIHPNPDGETDPETLEARLVVDARNPLLVGLRQPEALPCHL